jgi:ribosomal protein S18 acetylase RimI-like enzyme
MEFRLADAADAEAIAHLHAESWRRHYRGAYSDSFLDGDVVADRLAVWTERLREPDPRACTIVAENDGLAGFAHVILDADLTWGALLDNLHVAEPYKRSGIGSQLLERIAAVVVERAPGSGLWLWVLEQNVEAQAFYEARGARLVERAQAEPPGGDASRLAGSPMKLRHAWPEAAGLLA